MSWVKTSERGPTQDDADEFGNVICLFYNNEMSMLPWSCVVELSNIMPNQGYITHWMPSRLKKPELPEEKNNR